MNKNLCIVVLFLLVSLALAVDPIKYVKSNETALDAISVILQTGDFKDESAQTTLRGALQGAKLMAAYTQQEDAQKHYNIYLLQTRRGYECWVLIVVGNKSMLNKFFSGAKYNNRFHKSCVDLTWTPDFRDMYSKALEPADQDSE